MTDKRREALTRVQWMRLQTVAVCALIMVAGGITHGCMQPAYRSTEYTITLPSCDTIPWGLPAVHPMVGVEDTSLPPGMAGLAGTVADSLTGYALAGVMVKVSGPVERSTSTSSSGAFFLANVPAGVYRIVVARVGWEPKTTRISLVRDSVHTVTWKLRYEACPLTRRGVNDAILLRDAEMAEILQTADALWKAARTADSTALRRLSVGDTALTWAHRWRSAYPSFFDSTTGRLTARHGYFVDSARRIAVLEFEVPWVTCKPPVYAGVHDRYFVRVARASDSWVVWRVWGEPC